MRAITPITRTGEARSDHKPARTAVTNPTEDATHQSTAIAKADPMNSSSAVADI